MGVVLQLPSKVPEQPAKPRQSFSHYVVVNLLAWTFLGLMVALAGRATQWLSNQAFPALHLTPWRGTALFLGVQLLLLPCYLLAVMRKK